MLRRISSQSAQTGNYSSYHLDNNEFLEKICKLVLDYFSYHLENHERLKNIGKLILVQTIATSQIKRCDAVTPKGA